MRLLTDANASQTIPGRFGTSYTSVRRNGLDVCESRRELQDSVSAVTDCLGDLDSRGLLRWLPIGVVACAALPLVLYVLDAKLSSHSTPPPRNCGLSSLTSSQSRLRVVIDTMVACQDRFDAVEFVGRTTRYIVETAHSQQYAVNPARTAHGSGEISWTDILESRPDYYMRLVLVMDSSLSRDCLPEEEELPSSLQNSPTNTQATYSPHPNGLSASTMALSTPLFSPSTEVSILELGSQMCSSTSSRQTPIGVAPQGTTVHCIDPVVREETTKAYMPGDSLSQDDWEKLLMLVEDPYSQPGLQDKDVGLSPVGTPVEPSYPGGPFSFRTEPLCELDLLTAVEASRDQEC